MNIFKRPMFFAALVCGVSAFVSLYLPVLAIIIITIAVALFVFLAVKWDYKYITVLIAVIVFTISFGVQFANIHLVKECDQQKISGRFLVVSSPQTYDKFNTVTLKTLDNKTLPKGVKCLGFDYKKESLYAGDIIYATLKISSIDKNDEYRLYDYGNSVYATATVTQVEKTTQYNVFYKTAQAIRDYARDTATANFEGDTAGFLVALTTGDKTLISEDFSNNVNTTGISHIIVVSGMHLSIIITAVFFLIDRLFYNKYIRCVLSVEVVIIISAICGFTMSVLRAAATYLIAGLAPIFNRDNDPLSSLFTAVTIILISAPFAVANASFQLSVLSTLAVIWVVPYYSEIVISFFKIKSKLFKAVNEIVLCSVFANIFTLPVIIKMVGYTSIVSPFTNLIATYPVTIILVLNIIALVLSAIPGIRMVGGLFLWFAGKCSEILVAVINKIAQIPVTVAVLPKSSLLFFVSFILAIVAFMYLYEYKFKKKRSDINANSI